MISGTFNPLAVAATLGASFCVAGGCTTIVSGTKATPEAQGVRYSLPLTMLEVRPNVDGTIAVTPTYLADPNNQYVVSATSFLSSYTFDVALQSNGLLKSVSMDQNSAEVAKSAVTASGEVAKARLEAEQKASEARAKVATDAGNKVAEAKLAYDKAQAKLKLLIDEDALPEQILAARIAVIEAETDYNAALERARQTSGANLDAADGDGAGSAQFAFGNAWGPVYYRILQGFDEKNGEPTVQLIAARWSPDNQIQRTFLTATSAKPEQPTTENLKFIAKGSSEIAPNTQGRLQLTIEAINGSFAEAIRDSGLVIASDGVTSVASAIISGQSDGKTVIVDFPSDLDSGKYTLQFRYQIRPGATAITGEVVFSVAK